MEIKECVATTVEYVVRCYGHSMSGDADITSENAMFATDEILRALAEAGPTDGMVRAAAEEIEQGVKDYAVSDMDGGGFVTVEQAVQIARAALQAALKDMAGEG